MARYPNPFAAIRASWILSRARQRSQGLSQTELANWMGVGQAALSKYEGGSREPSFAELQRLVAGTDFRLEVRLRPEPRRAARNENAHRGDPMPFAADLHVSRRLPAQLSPASGHLPPSEADGPRLEEALLHLYEVEALTADLRRPEDRLQYAYERFHHERDRDLIHQMLPLGTGAGRAARILAREIDRAIDRETDQETDRPSGRRSERRQQNDPRAARLTWAYIVCCLRAEEAICRERATRLHRALDAAQQRRRAQIRVEDAEFIARTSGGPSIVAEIDQAKAALTSADQACVDHGRNGGGHDVGLSGERYIAAELTELADRARALYQELAREPAFETWRTSHAPTDPLYDAWLDGDLRDSPAPPRLYADWNALAADHRGLLASGQQQPGGTERLVTDPFGQQWQVVLGTRPDSNPDATAYVTAAHVAEDGQQTGPVYLLAAETDHARAADAVTTGAASLSAVAGMLRNASRER
ncbi:helix-turn-helix transcriptional regulator [Streptomyces sp. NPDC051183]|uniref:helix-turn-helix domain-containing protein n=1 Tax=Streptomyces sp. NPDC051183 TaxID=3155165 RepID=UPI00343A4162